VIVWKVKQMMVIERYESVVEKFEKEVVVISDVSGCGMILNVNAQVK
jgi:hypothetical protein